jgi:hypothetical protein
VRTDLLTFSHTQSAEAAEGMAFLPIFRITLRFGCSQVSLHKRWCSLQRVEAYPSNLLTFKDERSGCGYLTPVP